MDIHQQPSTTTDIAQALALRACAHILQEDSLKDRFLGLSGLDADRIRSNLTNPEFMLYFLEFLVMHEPDLLDFAEKTEVSPETVVKAWRSLGGGKGQEW